MSNFRRMQNRIFFIDGFYQLVWFSLMAYNFSSELIWQFNFRWWLAISLKGCIMKALIDWLLAGSGRVQEQDISVTRRYILRRFVKSFDGVILFSIGQNFRKWVTFENKVIAFCSVRLYVSRTEVPTLKIFWGGGRTAIFIMRVCMYMWES